MHLDTPVDHFAEIGSVAEVPRAAVDLVNDDACRRALLQKPKHLVEDGAPLFCRRFAFLEPFGNVQLTLCGMSLDGVAAATIQIVNKSHTVAENLDGQAITINRDRLRLFIIRRPGKLRDRQDWTTLLGIMVSVPATLATSDFHDQCGIPAVYIKVFFVPTDVIVGAVLLTTGWLRVLGESVEDLVKSTRDGPEP